jgi:hypothetical protein
MQPIQIEFRMPFENQTLPPEWDWQDFAPYYNPEVNYLDIAKQTLRDIPFDGPSRVTIRAGNRLLAVWSRYNERRELLGI